MHQKGKNNFRVFKLISRAKAFYFGLFFRINKQNQPDF